MAAFFEIIGLLVLAVFLLAIAALVAYAVMVVFIMLCKIIWVVIKDPLSDLYFFFTDRKRKKKRKRKLKYYEDYSKFRYSTDKRR